MDEAGDLGFCPHSSKTFVIGYMLTNMPPFDIRNKCKRLLHDINKIVKPSSKINEFKFSANHPETRLKFLKLISTLDISIGLVAIRKDSVSSQKLKCDPNLMYSYLANQHIVPVIIRHYLKSTMPYNRIKFVIDQSLSKDGRRKFNDHFDGKLSFVKYQEGFKGDIYAEVRHENSLNDVCLQIADYVASSCYAMTERGDRQYYDIVKGKIKHRDKWDWNEKICW